MPVPKTVAWSTDKQIADVDLVSFQEVWYKLVQSASVERNKRCENV